MNTLKIGACVGLALALMAGGAATRGASGADDETANVRTQCHAFVTAWNNHDPKAMAAVFAEDGDALNPFGRLATGRAEIEKLFADEQTGKGPMRESTLEVKEEPIRFPSADIAVSDASVVVTGAYGPDGKKAGPMNVHVTDVWKKVGGTWQVYSCRAYFPARAPGSTPPEK